ncbi:prephenate dehydrogenase/arogenate dehydrogenase family protein [Methylonatrum kenyense]|uniref:prephenate dehydrogenase n=1 Tax=Methylonatrum kenyense TaxID=455253 RepID=UPI0020BDD2EB|nr:prephenate dehydrogenase/arogenate dehydrogenase family protein [Methylonatrum kenyense]MCK8515972.1 prephenate dehydrogenase/arogenate dehydrogenase family protein [Methylonatrum kenyense]
MSSAAVPVRRLCVIGVGLIGGSLARALRLAGQAEEVVGCGRGLANLERARELGVIDRFETDPGRAVVGADMVLLAVPLSAMDPVMTAIAPTLEPDCVVTDGGSAKASVVEAARATLGPALPRFVPGHPIAGTENSGVEASFPELYRGRKVILTPLEETAVEAVATVKNMWEACGARVSCMSVAHHDEVLAATSHMPHVLAFALVDALSRWGDRDEIFAYAAGGFRDFTRIASSDPLMWRDICLANHEAVVAALERYTGDLTRMTEAVRRQDGEALERAFRNARDARERFLAMLES